MLRNYVRKYDMDEPPKFEDPLDESDYRMKRIKDCGAADQVLEEKYYRYSLHHIRTTVRRSYLSSLSFFILMLG